MSTTAKKKEKKENRNRNRNRKKVNDTTTVLTFTRVSALPGRPVPSGMRQKKRKEKKKGGRKTYMVIGLMPLAVRCRWSLCASKRMVGRASKSWEGHGLVMHAMWVQAVIVVVKTLRRRGRFRLLAKRERGRAKTVFGCVSRGCANAQDWEKKKRKNEKKRKKKEKEKRTHCGPIHRLHATGSSTLADSLWVEGRGRSRVDHRSCAETVVGG